MRDGQTSSGNGGWWSGGGETARISTSQPPTGDFPPKWVKFSWDWQEKGKGKARPWCGLGSISTEWNLSHHQQTRMKRRHSFAPDMLASTIERQGHVIYSNTDQPCKGLEVLSLPSFGRCLSLGPCQWDVPIARPRTWASSAISLRWYRKNGKAPRNNILEKQLWIK